MKENSMSYKTAKQETERLICEIEEATITHRSYTAECLRRVLKENEQLKNDIENMYDEEVVISIIEDNFNLSRNEFLEVLGSEE
nr:MAG TPA: hypothetical protein [Caudoviricetes sp.]